MKFDPSLFLSKHLIGQEQTEAPAVQAVIDTLTKEGVEWTGRTSDLAENIQPRFQANIHKDFFTDQDLSKSTRQAIRTARNKGIQVQFGGTELLEDFASLMKRLRHVKAFICVGKTTTKTTHNLPRTILHYFIYSRSRETENLPYKKS